MLYPILGLTLARNGYFTFARGGCILVNYVRFKIMSVFPVTGRRHRVSIGASAVRRFRVVFSGPSFSQLFIPFDRSALRV